MKKFLSFVFVFCLLVSASSMAEAIAAKKRICVGLKGQPLTLPGCCAGKPYKERPMNPAEVNPYQHYSVCCAGNIVDEFDEAKSKCCESGSLKGKVISVSQRCD